MAHNQRCDVACNTAEYFYDNWECEHVSKCSCEIKLLGNHVCNPQCVTPECLYDFGDCCDFSTLNTDDCSDECYSWQFDFGGELCRVEPSEYCPCDKSHLGDGRCHEECNMAVCLYDYGDCCEAWMLNNGICDPWCNNHAFHYDGGDCANIPECECQHALLQNNLCDEECAIAKCGFDLGDCCDNNNLRNGICDLDCYTAQYKFDDGDCKPVKDSCKCPHEVLGEGECN